MVERFVGIVFFQEGDRLYNFEISTGFETYGEAVSFIEGCSDNKDFDYGIVEKRFQKGVSPAIQDVGEQE